MIEPGEVRRMTFSHTATYGVDIMGCIVSAEARDELRCPIADVCRFEVAVFRFGHPQ